VTYQGEEAMLVDEAGVSHPAPQEHLPAMSAMKRTLGGFFGSADGFAEIGRINYVDGVRIHFVNGDVAHLRPSGNADELRIYAVADQQARADAIASLAVAEPNGILRRMEKAMC
jgi:phosphomannomutase